MRKKILILGSTGSIGLSTLNIVEKKPNYFNIILLSSNKNFKVICKQIKKYKPKYFLISDKKTFLKTKKNFKNSKTIIINNLDTKKFNFKSDLAITAIPGLAGLKPTIDIIEKTKKILIANKESIICGWKFIVNKAKKNKTKIIPVDSEHYSIFQLLKNHKIDEIEKIIITASGGPFLNLKLSKFKYIKPQEALLHPKWKMGKKISVDSATLMNKVIELIEAQKLFKIPKNKIDILVHPNSLVHAIIKLKNGLCKLIYHETTMIIPLANAIFDGKLKIENFLPKNKIFKFSNFDNLIFKKPDQNIFPIIKIKDRITEFESTPIIINAANEVLVDQFIKKNTSFLSIAKIIMSIMNDRNYRKYAVRNPENIKQISVIDNWARKTVLEKMRNYR